MDPVHAGGSIKHRAEAGGELPLELDADGNLSRAVTAEIGAAGARDLTEAGESGENFHITEKFRAELKMTAYNALNNLNRYDPSTNVYDSNFGKALYQGSPGGTFGSQASAYNSGRQVELGFKILW